MRIFRHGWPIIIPLYDARQCPECCCLVAGKTPRRNHERWHAELENALERPPESTDPGGFVVGGEGWSVASITGGEAPE